MYAVYNRVAYFRVRRNRVSAGFISRFNVDRQNRPAKTRQSRPLDPYAWEKSRVKVRDIPKSYFLNLFFIIIALYINCLSVLYYPVLVQS